VPAAETSPDPVQIVIDDGIACVTLDRPPLNVLDVGTLRRLNAVLRQCDAPSIRVVLLSTALPAAFSAGVEVRDHAAERVDAMLAEVRENARLLFELPPVTIAAIRGSTLGGGAEIALLCDLAIGADDLVIRLPEISLAAFPPVAAAILPELCGPRMAIRLLLGESMDAAAAFRAGLLSRVVPAARLQESARALAAEIAGHSQVALRGLTAASRRQRAPAALQRLDAAITIYRTTVGPSRDAGEGIAAFLEKRAPRWSHH
jgi:cyclohexa-1,5-dienecarbonyl-CoA hydratase